MSVMHNSKFSKKYALDMLLFAIIGVIGLVVKTIFGKIKKSVNEVCTEGLELDERFERIKMRALTVIIVL